MTKEIQRLSDGTEIGVQYTGQDLEAENEQLRKALDDLLCAAICVGGIHPEHSTIVNAFKALEKHYRSLLG